MNKTSIFIVLGVLAFMIIGIVLFVGGLDYQGETVILMDDETIAANLELTEVKIEEVMNEQVGFSHVGSEFMLAIMSQKEHDQFIDAISNLYMKDFAGYVNLDVQTESYYSENSTAIQETIGLESFEQFERLYNKLVVIPDYDECHVEFLNETVLDDGTRVYVDLRVTYDQISEVEFYLILDKKTLEHKIF